MNDTMPLDLHFAEDGTRATLTGSDELEPAALVATVRNLYGDLKRTAKLRCVLYDYTGVLKFEFSKEDVHAVAEMEQPAVLANPGLVLCIAASEQLLANLEWLWGSHALIKKPWRIETFQSRAEAEAWLKTF